MRALERLVTIVEQGSLTKAAAALHLFALTNTFLTGQTLHIDGGEPLTRPPPPARPSPRAHPKGTL